MTTQPLMMMKALRRMDCRKRGRLGVRVEVLVLKPPGFPQGRSEYAADWVSFKDEESMRFRPNAYRSEAERFYRPRFQAYKTKKTVIAGRCGSSTAQTLDGGPRRDELGGKSCR